MNPHDFASHIMAMINALPVEERREAIQALLADMLNVMPVGSIREMRAEIVAQFDPSIPIIASTLDQIDGSLALREIALLPD